MHSFIHTIQNFRFSTAHRAVLLDSKDVQYPCRTKGLKYIIMNPDLNISSFSSINCHEFLNYTVVSHSISVESFCSINVNIIKVLHIKYI